MHLSKERCFITQPDNDVEENRFLRLIDSLSNVAVQGYDKQRKVIYWNQSSTELYGYEPEEALGQRLEDLIIPEPMRELVIKLQQQWLNQGIPKPSGELILQNKQGDPVPVFSSHVMLKGNSGSPEMFCVDIDLTEQYSAREKLKLMATTDLLTGLPNRRHLNEQINQLIQNSNDAQSSFALFFIDLDLFKEVNDTMGHAWGDLLLTTVVQRIERSLLQDELFARFGGDEFVLLASNIGTPNQASERANQIIQLFTKNFPLGSEWIHITASIGIALFPQDGKKATTLLKNADSAMYRAKDCGRNRYPK